MRIKSFSESALNIYLHCWYIPLFAFLFGIKLCLISMLADSIQKVEQNRFDQLLAYDELKLPTIKSKAHLLKRQAVSVIKSETTTISPETINDWKILDNLENSTIQPTAKNRTGSDSIWIVFNRIPRCGGNTMVELLHKLGENNGFSHQEHEYRTPWQRFLLEQEQENLVTWFEYQHLPKTYDRHFYFVNFTAYQKFIKEMPIYINIVRDPILRLKSTYQAKRKPSEFQKLEVDRRNKLNSGSGKEWLERSFEKCVEIEDPECSYKTGNVDYTLMVPFFCGQHPSCVIINNKWAIQRAKFTIEKYYSVVGVLEKWNDTMKALEIYIPKFFNGVNELYYQGPTTIQPHVHNKKKLHRNYFKHSTSTTKQISKRVRTILEKKIYGEYELYNFIVQRLNLQVK